MNVKINRETMQHCNLQFRLLLRRRGSSQQNLEGPGAIRRIQRVCRGVVGARIEKPKAPRWERRRRDNRGAEGAEGGVVWGGVFPLPNFLFGIRKRPLLVHSGRYLLQFVCTFDT